VNSHYYYLYFSEYIDLWIVNAEDQILEDERLGTAGYESPFL